jgi:hypothetical protein
MVTTGLAMRSAATAALVLTVGLLAGCSSPDPGTAEAPDEYPDISLAESKSNAQLLRNSAESRIAAEVIDSSTEADSSVACLSAAEDPDGEIRRWLSSSEVNLVRWHAWRVDDVADILIDTFVDQSWSTIDVDGEYTDTGKLLTSGNGVAEIQVETVGTEDDSAATIHVTVTGPCVRTDGADSDEVTSLEE